MVWISAFGRLVLASTVDVLTAEDRICLQSFLPTEPVPIHVRVTLRRNIEQLKRGALPEVIAAVDELVYATVEATLFTYLPLAEPLRAPI